MRWLEKSGEPGILVSQEEISTELEFEKVRDLAWFDELLAKQSF